MMQNMDKNSPTGGDFRSGFIAIVGSPNAGKSTLLNRIVGQKVSITSRKPQTTRNRILAIAQRPGAQLIFIDTPGIHDPRGNLNVRIVETAVSAIKDTDVVLWVADAENPEPVSEQRILEALADCRAPVLLALNKIDLMEKPLLLNAIEQWSCRFAFAEIVPISATKGTQVELLVDALERALPKGPALFPRDSLTDMPERFIVAEMIREKVFRLTGQEIPYAIAVTVDSFREPEDPGKATVIHATVHVERDSQKGILIGKGGGKLKSIGAAARIDIEELLAGKVYLKLFVRVQKNWRKDDRALRRFGYS